MRYWMWYKCIDYKADQQYWFNQESTSLRFWARSALLNDGAVPKVTLDLTVRTDAAVLCTAKDNTFSK